MFAVSPLQMRFRTPRRADTRRSCLQARTCAGEMATFAIHKRIYSQKRGASAPRGWVTRVRRKSQIPSRRAFVQQHKSGDVSLPRFAEARSQCHRPVTRNTTDAPPATAIAMTFASSAAAVSCMLAVSPLQMRFRTPRRADARRSCALAFVHRRSRNFADKRSRCKVQERGASAPRGWATVISTTFIGAPPTVSCMFAVSPLQMRFRTPRRADVRRSCLNARISAGEMTTFAMHKRVYSQERGRQHPVAG
jgi:hypothetical protein